MSDFDYASRLKKHSAVTVDGIHRILEQPEDP